MKKSDNLIGFLESAGNSGKGITFIRDTDHETFLSYKDLFSQAALLLENLRGRGVGSGDILILQVEDNRMFLTLFWACLLGKIVPVPLTLAHTDEYRLKLQKVWEVLRNPFAVLDQGVSDDFEAYLILHGQEKTLGKLRTNGIVPNDFTQEKGQKQKTEKIDPPAPSDTAYIQFSSGSTGDPKGIVLTHNNLLDNIHAFLAAKKSASDDSYLSWLPLSHDMGLIGWHLNPLVAHVDQYLMPPKAFVGNPLLWFDKVSEHKVAVTCSPSFGFTHFLKFAGKGKMNDWDLSCVRLIVNGAEHISHDLCNSFLDEMAPFGLKRSALMPGYGLAEATLAVAVSPCAEEFTTHYLDVNSLGVGERVIDVLPADQNCAAYVDEGELLAGFTAGIYDDEDNIQPEETIGHILLKGPSVSRGYVNNPVATEESFTGDRWLRTGDLGFIRNRRMIITGRSKEMIIIGGMNYYPHDIERVAAKEKALSGRTVVACGVYDGKNAAEELILFVSHKKTIEAFIPVVKGLKERMAREFNLPVSRVLPVKSIPRTTSGKTRRMELGRLYHAGDFDPVVRQLNQLLHARLSKIQIRDMPPEERLQVTAGFVREQAEALMGLGRIDPDLSLTAQGFDSLMGIELRNVIECSFGITVPVSWFREDESLLQFSARLLQRALENDESDIDSGAFSDEDDRSQSSILDQLKDMDRMSEDEIREMIRALEG